MFSRGIKPAKTTAIKTAPRTLARSKRYGAPLHFSRESDFEILYSIDKHAVVLVAVHIFINVV